MSKLKASVLTAGSLALVMSGGAALAAGTVPTGTADIGLFSIDDVGFDAGGDMRNTACPVGFTCNQLIGSSADMLQREVINDSTGVRTLQMVIGEAVDVLGDGTVIDSFAIESQHRFDTTNNIDSQMIMDEQSQAFYTEQTMFRGDGDPSGGFPQQETIQILGGGFQTFEMVITDMAFNSNEIGNNDAAYIAIDQGTGGAAGRFAHRILKGGGQATDFSVDVFDGDENNAGNITVAGGAADGALTATYVSNDTFSGGLAPNADFGVMIYRYWDDVADNSAGSTQGAVPTQEIRATSRVSSEQDDMTGAHGVFDNANASQMGWDDTLFGTAPDVF